VIPDAVVTTAEDVPAKQFQSHAGTCGNHFLVVMDHARPSGDRSWSGRLLFCCGIVLLSPVPDDVATTGKDAPAKQFQSHAGSTFL
jgi:hypothetical protein